MNRRAIGWVEVGAMFAVIALIACFHRLEGPAPVEATTAVASSAAYSVTPIDPVEAAWDDGRLAAERDLASPTPWDAKFTVRVATAFYTDPPARSEHMSETEARDAGYDKKLAEWVRGRYKQLPAGEIAQWAVDASRPWEVYARHAGSVVTLTRGGPSLYRGQQSASRACCDVYLGDQGVLDCGSLKLEGTFFRPMCVAVAPFLFVTEDGVYSVYDLRDGRLISRVHAQMVE